MNIFYVTDEMLDERSAETVHIDAISKNLVALGHQVTLYAPGSATFHEDKAYPLRYIDARGPLFSPAFQLGLFRSLRRDARKSRPDIIYVRHNHLLFVPALVSRLTRIPLVLEVNGRIVEEAGLIDHSFLGRLLLASGIVKLLDSFTSRTAATLIVVAPAIRDYLMNAYDIPADKIAMITNGVDIGLFAPSTRAVGGPLTIGYIGSLYPWQGVRSIVAAAATVLELRPDVRFRIRGNGSDKVWVEAFVRENDLERSIEIMPAVAHDTVPRYVNELDICLCYPSRFRDGATSPFKVYEYLACGKATIVADIGGMRQEFGDSVAYAEPESPHDLARAIIALIDDMDARSRLGIRGRAFVEDGHTWRAVASKIADLCARIAR
jgi:glycosyltransferase involved in cell wall biosynthesis